MRQAPTSGRHRSRSAANLLVAAALATDAVLPGAGMTFRTIGSRAAPVAEPTLITMIEALLAHVWVFLLLAEQASVNTLLGGAVALSAVAANTLNWARRRPPAPPGAQPAD
ncbi:MAG: hypothetical protein ACE37J_20335 [Pikeienuella sp.]|uniref:hypothetical protein n=1 Tax=Pikeienuella sp. TaxID=2831957 RepID=UPI00391D9289